jgi:hypothetical protein
MSCAYDGPRGQGSSLPYNEPIFSFFPMGITLYTVLDVTFS